jgi:hypothetical protein
MKMEKTRLTRAAAVLSRRALAALAAAPPAATAAPYARARTRYEAALRAYYRRKENV